MKKIFLFFAFIAIVLTACKEDEIMTYSDTNGIGGVFFQRNASVSYAPGGTSVIVARSFIDSMVINFAGSKVEVTDTIIKFPVKLIGNITDYDRKINFKINKDLTTAVEGIDFEVNYDTTYLKADANSANVDVKVFRTIGIRTNQVRIALDLVESDNLKLLMNSYLSTTNWSSTSNKTFNANTFKWIIVEAVTEPSAWNPDFFGVWTIDKYNELNDLMGWTDRMWGSANMASSPISGGIFPHTAYNFKGYLQAKADIGLPVKELDGSFMQLSGIYAVDYSKYIDINN